MSADMSIIHIGYKIAKPVQKGYGVRKSRVLIW